MKCHKVVITADSISASLHFEVIMCQHVSLLTFKGKYSHTYMCPSSCLWLIKCSRARTFETERGFKVTCLALVMFMVHGPCPPTVATHLDKPAQKEELGIYSPHSIYTSCVLTITRNC